MEFECETVDTLKLCRKLMPEQEKKNLGNACIYYKIEQPLAHRAEADALSAHFLYQKLVDFMEKNSQNYLRQCL